MKSRWILLLAIGAAPLVAHADWLPITMNDSYVVTVGATVNGQYGEITYSEDRNSGNFLPSVARDVYSITDALTTELDNQVRELAAREQLHFYRSELSGDMNVTLQPNGAGYLMTRVSGLNYLGIASGTKSWGPVTGTCTVTVTVTDIVATAQIGSATGGIPEDSVGLEAHVGSRTSCTNNLEWFPILGEAINIWAEHKASGILHSKARDALLKMKDKLFFERDANAYAGLNRIVPADKVIPLPNGQSFAAGQWLQGQLAWILNNVNANIVLGRGAKVEPFTGWTLPDYWVTGTVARFNLVVGGVTLNINMREEVLVEWQWYCNSWPCPEVP
jgi:hypothetical protein